MPVGAPPAAAYNEFLGATTRHTRRIEIYESDGITRWAKDTVSRLKGGSISVDYDRDERRSMDLTLANDDAVLQNAPGEFWYDKVIKVFRGVKVNQKSVLPKILIISDDTVTTAEQAPSFRSAMMDLGYGDVQVNTTASSYSLDLASFDIIVSLGNQNNGALLLSAYNAGKSVFVFRGSAQYFFDALLGNTTWAGSSVSIPGTYVELRRNQARNPHAVGATSWTANYGTGGAGALTAPTTGGPDNGSYARATFTTANTTAAGTSPGASVRYDGRAATALPLAVTPGQVISAAIQTRSSIAQRVAAQLLWFDASGGTTGITTTSHTGSGTVLTANTWTRLTLENITVPTGAAYCLISSVTVGGTGVVPFPIGATFDATMAQYEVATTIGAYFDGATAAPDEVTIYQWTGTVNASASTYSSYSPTGVVDPITLVDPRTVGWNSFPAVVRPDAYKAPATTVTGVFGISYHPGSTTNYAITSGTNVNNGRFVAVHFPVRQYQYKDLNFHTFLRAAVGWLNRVTPLTEWEVQIGEFMIDRISEPHFPYEMKITGRDYTKKCMLSKFAQATSFAAGNSLESIIATLASNAGITKRMLPATGIVVGRDFYFERGKSRWEAMKQICTAYNYEIYFDATGYLVIRPFRDPTTTTPIIYFETHSDQAQVAGYEKSTSDTQIFNHILVAGENSDQASVPVWAEAKNTTVGSPTSIASIGDRYWEYISEFVTTTSQAQTLANNYLAIKSLEEFELSWESLLFPWLEVGDIVGFIDPRPAIKDPTTFLLSSLTLPLTLGPMSAVGRRITIAS